MRISALAMWMVAMTADGTAVADRGSPCSFMVSAPVAAEVVVGRETEGRAFVMAQRDSPLAIIRADFGGMSLTAGTGSFTRTGNYVLDVKNVSDQVITEARVLIKVGFGAGSGVGTGTKLRRVLQPGEQMRLEWKSGTGRGSEATSQEVSVVALVAEVQLPGCTYRPAEAWPMGIASAGMGR